MRINAKCLLLFLDFVFWESLLIKYFGFWLLVSNMLNCLVWFMEFRLRSN